MNFIKKIKTDKEKAMQKDAKQNQAQYVDLRKAQSKGELMALVKGTEKKLDENLLDTMIPYADLMTLLLVFFVFFFIISSYQKYTSFKDIKTANMQIDMNETTITIPSEILFASGKAQLIAGAEQELDKIASRVKDSFPVEEGWQIRIEGHTDNVPISSEKYPSNWELSTARAISVMRVFINNHDISPSQLQVMGYGQHKPVAPNNNAINRRKNRRVEIKINRKYNEQ